MALDYTDDLRLAHVLADDADALSMARFKALDLHVMTKPDLTPVTDADQAVEEGIRRTLSRVRSRDAVLGEEQGSAGHSQRRWVVDPIDGTKNFVRGVPVWATLIALMVDDDLVVDHQRDQRCPDRYAPDEVLGAVDRIDHPATLVGNEGRRRLDWHLAAAGQRDPGL
jgi:fructose-1,6-bisphosphatase/inositol monophosphatase family enzyme